MSLVAFKKPTEHPYCIKKGFTLTEIQQAAGVPIYVQNATVKIHNGFWQGSVIFRTFIDVFGNNQKGEQILSEKIDKYGNSKLLDKFTLAGGSNSVGFTPFGFTIEQLPTLSIIYIVMGLADGYRVYQNRKLPVVCGAGEANLTNLVNQVRLVNNHAKIIVLADNDLAGITAAHKTHCHYALPSSEKDWSDIYQNKGIGALTQQLNNVKKPLPLFPQGDRAFPVRQKRPTLNKDIQKEINKLSRETRLDLATGRVNAILEKYEFRMPFEVDLAELTAALIIACKHSFNAQNINHLSGLIKTRLQHREKKSLSVTTFDYYQTRKHHSVILRTGLPVLSEKDFNGVLLFRAWKGIGKTETIGIPFVENSQNKGLTLAACHRMSLTDELCEKLGITNYRKDTFSIMDILGLGTCIPSISKAKYKYFIDHCEFVFIDEIAQVLHFLQSTHCSTKDGDNSVVYAKLRQLISNAKCIVGADAELNDTVIQFIEQCRPNERFTIYDINEISKRHQKDTPKDFLKANKYPQKIANVNYVVGNNSLSKGYANILNRIKQGDNIWIAVEGCERTEQLAQLIKTFSHDTKLIVVNSKNKGNKQQQAFLSDANNESTKYQVVIHSPVISSGISVNGYDPKTKKTTEHFNHTYFIGGGHCITPSDASQMLARVRYVNDYTLILLANNKKHQVKDARAIIRGKEQAALFEVNENSALTDVEKFQENLSYSVDGNASKCRASEFDHFCAKMVEQDDIAKADFASGLLWLMQQEGHKVKPLLKDVDNIDDEIKAAREQAQENYFKALIESDDISLEKYFELKNKSVKSWQETCEYQKYYIKHQLNIDELTREDIEQFDDGRTMSQMRRFAACFHHTAFEEKTDVKHLSHRKFSKAKVWAYQFIFNGIDLTGEKRISQQQARTIIDRVIEHRYVFAELGIVPAAFGKYYSISSNGKDNFPPRKTPIKDVNSIFKLMGLEINRKDNYHGEVAKNDYSINAEKLQQAHGLCEQIDFSRLGGYLLNKNTANAEINAAKWQKTKETALMLVNCFGGSSEAVAYLNKECENLGLSQENDEIKDFYEQLKTGST